MERPTWLTHQPPAPVKPLGLADAAMRQPPKKGDFINWPLTNSTKNLVEFISAPDGYSQDKLQVYYDTADEDWNTLMTYGDVVSAKYQIYQNAITKFQSAQ